MKKLVPALLIVCMCISLLPAKLVSAANSVASGTCGENLTWTLDSDGVLTISGTGAMENYNSSWPGWISREREIKSVVIEDGVTHIGHFAFKACKNITDITIGNTLESIGISAFVGCSGLESVTIPSNVTSIGNQSFGYCDNLKIVTLNEGLKTINENAFKECPNLVEINIPDTVEIIGREAFRKCTSLKSIDLGAGVKSIDGMAFYDCTNLESITIPDGIEEIGGNMFEGTAYYNKASNWYSGLLYIGNHLIEAKKDTAYVSIKAGTLTIANGAFYYCESLEKASIPSSVKNIGTSAFEGCGKLKSINIPEGVKSIGAWAFGVCNSLKSIVIPRSVTTIGVSAFAYCDNIESATIKGNVEMLDCAFNNNPKLKRVTLSKAVKTIGYSTFYGTALTDVYYEGSKSEWSEITIDEFNEPLTNATIHFADCIESSVVKSGSKIIVDAKTDGVEGAYKILIAAYKDSKFITVQSILSDEQISPCTFEGDIDEIRVIVVDALTAFKPLCNAKKILSDEWTIE